MTPFLRLHTATLTLFVALSAASGAMAQHEGHTSPPNAKPSPKQTAPPATPNKGEVPRGSQQHSGHGMGTQGMDHSGHNMFSSVDLNVSMNRAGSGTSWLPDSTPMYARIYMLGCGRDMFMLHSKITPRYLDAAVGRGQRAFFTPYCFMVMCRHLGSSRDQFGACLMSLDYIANGNNGYHIALPVRGDVPGQEAD